MKLQLKTKKLQISQAQSSMLLIMAGAVVISVFSLVSTKRLWSQSVFQRHVVNARRDAAKQLSDYLTSANQLVTRYNTIFANEENPTNVLGGRNTNNSKVLPPDGNNARIVLDALPSNYDFPALVSSVSQILSNNLISSPSIGGSDQSSTINDEPV